MTDDVVETAAAEAVAPDLGDTPTPPDPQIDRASEPTPRNAIDRAFEAVDRQEKVETDQPAKEKPQKAEATEQKADKPSEKTGDERPRNPDGTFKAKEGNEESTEAGEQLETVEKPVDPKPTSFADAPRRFSEDAKAEWKNAPEPIRAEITRAIREMEAGLEEYRVNFEPYREFAKELQANGQQFKDVLAHYRGIENKLAQDPIGGLEQICSNMGTSLRQVAAHVLNQTPDQAAAAQDAKVRALQQEIAGLKSELSGAVTSFRTQAEQQVMREIDAFAASKPRFEELHEPIAKLLQTGMAKDLGEAYDMAERLNPAPVTPASPPEPAPAPVINQDRQAQTLKGQKSLSGAPSSGSNPANRKPPSTAREALDRAFNAAGL